MQKFDSPAAVLGFPKWSKWRETLRVGGFPSKATSVQDSHATCYPAGTRLSEQVGKADGSRFMSGNPSTALPPQRSGSPL
ncbi:hypothetical protein [Dendronalium sp. ChiSLP03b]|uniref:hypothetical protein n=1 Tax=Dendronalium sp. ChiSLP03b TaxID=3075381 RepID=UPI002AD237C1|nr:hypothetical protein [Dendronalium sp. ChiSLP03b]MDZ8205002.1 hypothetical protein [Dendronalium sp. ChiSLP03b]